MVIPTLDSIDRTMWDAVQRATGVTEDSDSGILRNLVRVCAAQLFACWGELQQLADAGDLSTATGADLDRIGDLFGLVRFPARTAATAGTGAAVLVTNTTSVPVNVRQGARVWASGDPTLAFYTTADSGAIAPGAQAQIDVVAAAAGAFYNAGAGRLDSINVPGVSVTNPLPVTGGDGEESDAAFRVRIMEATATFASANPTAIRNRLLEIPQVRDVLIRNLARGTGTFDVVLTTTDMSADAQSQVLAAAQAVLDRETALGVSAIARLPDMLAVDLTVTLALAAGADLPTVRTNVTIAVRTYLDNLPISDGAGQGDLIYAELLSRIVDASPQVTDAQLAMRVKDAPVLAMNQHAASGARFTLRSIAFV